MKKLIILLLAIFLQGCDFNMTDADVASRFIDSNKKPIIVYKKEYRNYVNVRDVTMISANGKILLLVETNLILPDTIK